MYIINLYDVLIVQHHVLNFSFKFLILKVLHRTLRAKMLFPLLVLVF
jgi:hypothetical protein